MAIENGHEDRDPAAGSRRGFRGNADGEDRSVGRRNDGFFAPLRRALRIAKELEEEESREAENRRDDRMAEPQEEAGCQSCRKDEGVSVAGDRKLQWVTPAR